MADRGPAGLAPGAGSPRVRSRGVRRAVSQAGLVVALLAVFTVCATGAGTCALLLTAGNERALSAAVAQADGSENTGSPDIASVVVLSSTTNAEGAPPADAGRLAPLVRQSLTDASRPYRAEVSLWTTTPMLFLSGTDVRNGYLLDADTLTANASLRSGTWPTPPATVGGSIPVAIPAATAAALGATVGTELRLSRDRHDGNPVPPVYHLVVAGIFEPADSLAWNRDTLHGRGYDPSYLRLPTFGPFVVAPGTLELLAAPVAKVDAVLDPDLAGDAAGVPDLVRGVQAVADRIKDAAGASINPVLVWFPLGAAFDDMRTELGVTNALVLAVLLVVLALGATTASLVARVLVGRRAGESTLLRDRGASTSQLLIGAATEAAVIAVVAFLCSVPLALAAYGATAPAAALAGSWAGLAATHGPVLVIALIAGAALPAVVAVIAALPERSRRGRQVISGPVARSGIDVMLALVAAVAYFQLRSHLVSAGAVDLLLVVAPAVCVIAVAALVTRLVPLAARAANAAARRGRGVVLPLAGWHLARGGAAQVAFLLVLAASVGTLGATYLGTWSTSQGDQAAAMVGADLVVGQAGGPDTARTVADATRGSVTPVADRAVVLGSRPSGVKVLGLDATLADSMLRGRLPDGAAWSSEMAGLAPQAGGAPLTTAGGPLTVTVTGGLANPVGSGLVVPIVTAAPTLVLANAAGYRTTQVGSDVALDGRPHAIHLPIPGQQALPAGSWRIVAIDLHLLDHTTQDLIGWGNTTATIKVSVSVEGASSVGGAWGTSANAGLGGVQPGDAVAHSGTVDASFGYSVLGLSWEEAHVTLLSFPASTQVPVVMTQTLAGELGLAAGDRIALTWGSTPVEAVLVRTVPYVPSHVREAALLVDRTSLERGLLSAGLLEPVVDAWWVSSPRPGSAEALRAAHLGPVTTLGEVTSALRDGPLRAPLPVAWLLAIAAAVGLAVTGSAAHAAAEAQRRASTIARVRAIGVSKRDALASHLVQHAAVTSTAVVLGTLAGAVLAWLLAPLLVVSPRGEPAIPPAALAWSIAPTAAVVGAILVGGLLAGVPAAVSVVRRSTVAALRAGDAR